MSSDGQNAGPPAIVVAEFALPRGLWFDRHRHAEHQLAWAASGLVHVHVGERTWILPPGLALWLPAGLDHRTGCSAATIVGSLYFVPDRCPAGWREPTVLAVPPLLRELIDHLAGPDLEPGARLRAEAVVFDLMRPVPVTPLGVPEPADERLRVIAAALRADPTDGSTLAEWGDRVGASARNLARLFRADTGLTFGAWRTQVRLRAALPLLSAGLPVGRVAGRVGYATPSAFVAAFHRAVGVPPGAYFAGAG